MYLIGVISSTLRATRAFSRGGERSRKPSVVAHGMDPSTEKSLFGENFGARDAYAGELESNFAEKVLGNWDVRYHGFADGVHLCVSLPRPFRRLSTSSSLLMPSRKLPGSRAKPACRPTPMPSSFSRRRR